jgi:hypothetical protein
LNPVFTEFASSLTTELKEQIVEQVKRGDYDAKLALDKCEFNSVITFLSSKKFINFDSVTPGSDNENNGVLPIAVEILFLIVAEFFGVTVYCFHYFDFNI